jgi:hypothetical protein
VSAQASEPAVSPNVGVVAVPISEVRPVEGWTVHISSQLLATNRVETERCLVMLAAQLKMIVERVPGPAAALLQEVPLWVSPEYPGVPPRAEYHPGRDWLVQNGRDPAMVKGVEFTNVRIFESEVRRMPVFVLHELAHAYHDRVLGFDDPAIQLAYRHAVEGKKYDSVERVRANGTVVRERAYAMTNEQEYFAEGTEAYFGNNDFFPFTRDELAKHDPELFTILEKVWQGPKGK